jgi:hypothetical protein
MRCFATLSMTAGGRGRGVGGGACLRGLTLEMGQGLELEGLVLEWASGSVVGRGLVERWVEERRAMEAWRRVEEPAPTGLKTGQYMLNEFGARGRQGSVWRWGRL